VGRDRPLGELERAVLDRLWASGPTDVKSLHGSLGRERGLAPTTIQSTLERLFRKGLLERSKRGRAFVYRPRLTRREWVARTLAGAIDAVPGADARLLLAAFVDLAERAGAAQLEELERLVRQRRGETRSRAAASRRADARGGADAYDTDGGSTRPPDPSEGEPT